MYFCRHNFPFYTKTSESSGLPPETSSISLFYKKEGNNNPYSKRFIAARFPFRLSGLCPYCRCDEYIETRCYWINYWRTSSRVVILSKINLIYKLTMRLIREHRRRVLSWSLIYLEVGENCDLYNIRFYKSQSRWFRKFTMHIVFKQKWGRQSSNCFRL